MAATIALRLHEIIYNIFLSKNDVPEAHKKLLSVNEIILTILGEMAIISPIFTLTKKLVCRLSQVCGCFQFSLIQGIWKRKGLFSYYTGITTIKTFI